MSSSIQRARRREQRDNTRREILGATERFLRERPYRELSVEAVMAQTGLTRTAFYRHFEDITALVLQLLEDVASELYAIAETWIEGASLDFAAAAHNGLQGSVAFFERNGPLVRAIAEAAATDEEVEQGYGRLLDAFVEMTALGLERLVERGELDAVDTAQLARALNLMNEKYLLDQFGREPFGDPAIALATLETVWMRTLEPLRVERAWPARTIGRPNPRAGAH